LKVSSRCYPDSTANIFLLLMAANAFYSKPTIQKIQWPRQILTFFPGPGTSLLQENPHLFPIGEVSYHHTVRPSGPDNIKCICLTLFSVMLKGDRNTLTLLLYQQLRVCILTSCQYSTCTPEG